MLREHAYWVYIFASDRNGTLYVGVTNDLYRRVMEHREELVTGFTKRYAVKRLVYFEEHGDVEAAIAREKYQAMAARMEAAADRASQSAVARSVARDW